MAPYCAIPRDYLSDPPLLRVMGLLGSQHGQLGAIPPPPFLSVSPYESMRSGGAIPPHPTKAYLSDTCVIPHENKAKWGETPLCNTISKYSRERGNRALVIVFQSRPFFRLRNAFKNSVFEASKFVPTKNLSLKHDYRLQGYCVIWGRISHWAAKFLCQGELTVSRRAQRVCRSSLPRQCSRNSIPQQTPIGADFWEGNATKHMSVKKRGKLFYL